TVPTAGPFVAHSPFSLIRHNGQHVLLKNGSHLTDVSITPSPQYYALQTADGIPYKQIALLHGINCLASTVLQKCTYWNTPERCQFCGIEISLNSSATTPQKTPEQLLEVAQTALRLGSISHITLTAGSQADTTSEVEHLASCCTHLKSGTDLPIHVQIIPPRELGLLELLKQSGADTIGIHIESFDQTVLNRIAPCKTHYSLEDFINTWKESVRLFGINQVSSFIILGLGETSQSVIEGVKLLCDLGVYPFIVPLRPIPGTPLGMDSPPNPEYMISIYEQTAVILKKSGLSWKKSKAGCVRCGACSGLPDFEDET
ncbi:MAG: MSMEG_0568 family radical SAM protein, partial [Thermodesulfobacteriota bacterium]|nr:MSMEG_0568 family radical SAM protein [Thermodesulfobacteriota bacterium]